MIPDPVLGAAPRDTQIFHMGFNDPRARVTRWQAYQFFVRAFEDGMAVDIRMPRPVPGAPDPRRFQA